VGFCATYKTPHNWQNTINSRGQAALPPVGNFRNLELPDITAYLISNEGTAGGCRECLLQAGKNYEWAKILHLLPRLCRCAMRSGYAAAMSTPGIGPCACASMEARNVSTSASTAAA
jgi:hypothetical protein